MLSGGRMQHSGAGSAPCCSVTPHLHAIPASAQGSAPWSLPHYHCRASLSAPSILSGAAPKGFPPFPELKFFSLYCIPGLHSFSFLSTLDYEAFTPALATTTQASTTISQTERGSWPKKCKSLGSCLVSGGTDG